MIGWSTAAPVIKSLFGSLAVDPSLITETSPAFAAEWKDGARGATHSEQRFSLLLKVTNVSPIGVDETRDEEVSADSEAPSDAGFLGALRSIQCGIRRVTIQVQTVVPEHTDDFWGIAALERLRVRIRRRPSLAVLNTLNMALVSIGQALKVNFRDNGRWTSAAVMDIVLCSAFSDVDPVPLGWIEAVDLTSRLRGTDGQELPSPPNWSEVIPEGWIHPDDVPPESEPPESGP